MQRICQDIKIIFIGTPEFAAIILDALVASNYTPVAVITAPDKPVGRKQTLTSPPVKILAEKYKILILQPEKIRNLELEIRNLRPDLIIVSSYGQIIPKNILDIPRYCSLNVHPSLLPKYRGPSPIQATILNGDTEIGVTVIKMTEKVDAGSIIVQHKLEISHTKITYPELHDKLAQLGAQLLIETIPKWINGKIKPMPQDDSRATYTKIIKKEDGKIDWDKPAKYIERQIRALNPWPGSFTEIKYQKLKIKILESDVIACDNNKSLGNIFLTEDKKLAVQTGKDCLIIRELQLEGKNKMTAQEFLNGHPEVIGSILA